MFTNVCTDRLFILQIVCLYKQLVSLFDLSWFNIIVERLCHHLVGMTCAFGVRSSVGYVATVIELLVIFM